jgi:hypothetical protein
MKTKLALAMLILALGATVAQAAAPARVKTWVKEELSAADLNAEFNNLISALTAGTADLAVGIVRASGEVGITGTLNAYGAAKIVGALTAQTGAFSSTVSEGGTLLSAKYLGISAQAADSAKLAGNTAATYGNSKATIEALLTGTITSHNHDGVAGSFLSLVSTGTISYAGGSSHGMTSYAPTGTSFYVNPSTTTFSPYVTGLSQAGTTQYCTSPYAWSSHASEGYDTFTSASGTSIASAIKTGAGNAYAYTKDSSTYTVGKYYRASITLTLNSGQAPWIHVGAGRTDYTGAVFANSSVEPQLSNGANVLYFKQTAGSSYFFFKNTSTTNWSAVISIVEVAPGLPLCGFVDDGATDNGPGTIALFAAQANSTGVQALGAADLVLTVDNGGYLGTSTRLLTMNGAGGTTFGPRDLAGATNKVYVDGRTNTGTLILRNPVATAGTALVWVPSSSEVTITSSSRRFKHDIKTMMLDWNRFMKIRPVTYTENHSGQKNMVGLVAEELNGIYPAETIRDGENKPFSIDYQRMVAPTIAAVQDLKRENDELKAIIKSMDKRFKALEKKR